MNYIVYCTLYDVHCTLYSVHVYLYSTLYSISRFRITLSINIDHENFKRTR